jgi:hypothetical protein
MGKKSIHVTSLPFVGKDGENCLYVSVDYDEGGCSFSGEHSRRGFYACVMPVKVDERGRTRIALGAGRKCFLEETTRSNARKLGKLAALCMEHEGVKKCIEVVCREYGKAE